MAAGRHIELRKTIIICTSLIWLNHANIIPHYNAFGSLAGIIVIRDQRVLVIFGGHLGFGIKMTPKYIFKTRNGFDTLKLVGLEELL